MSEQLHDYVNKAHLRRIEQNIDRNQAIMERLESIINSDNTIPGSLVTGRSNRSAALSRALDRENDRIAKAYTAWSRAKQAMERWILIREAYIAGKCHPNGQKRVAGRAEAVAAARQRHAAKSAHNGFDTRKIHEAISIDGYCVLDDGRKVSLDINGDRFIDDLPGYRFVVHDHLGHALTATKWHACIAALETSGELRGLLLAKKTA